jgi:hypothetical protein
VAPFRLPIKKILSPYLISSPLLSMASAPQTIMPSFLDQLRFQSLDDFIQEQDEIQAQLQAE